MIATECRQCAELTFNEVITAGRDRAGKVMVFPHICFACGLVFIKSKLILHG
jgi:uncharacterized Zn finger protein